MCELNTSSFLQDAFDVIAVLIACCDVIRWLSPKLVFAFCPDEENLLSNDTANFSAPRKKSEISGVLGKEISNVWTTIIHE